MLFNSKNFSCRIESEGYLLSTLKTLLKWNEIACHYHSVMLPGDEAERLRCKVYNEMTSFTTACAACSGTAYGKASNAIRRGSNSCRRAVDYTIRGD